MPATPYSKTRTRADSRPSSISTRCASAGTAMVASSRTERSVLPPLAPPSSAPGAPGPPPTPSSRRAPTARLVFLRTRPATDPAQNSSPSSGSPTTRRRPRRVCRSRRGRRPPPRPKRRSCRPVHDEPARRPRPGDHPLRQRPKGAGAHPPTRGCRRPVTRGGRLGHDEPCRRRDVDGLRNPQAVRQAMCRHKRRGR